MRRKILSGLLKWRKMTAGRMPLLIYGARQVGKTYMMKRLGAEYFRNTIYVNFEADEIISDFFQTDIHADAIVGILEKYYHQPVYRMKHLSYLMKYRCAKGRWLL